MNTGCGEGGCAFFEEAKCPISGPRISSKRSAKSANTRKFCSLLLCSWRHRLPPPPAVLLVPVVLAHSNLLGPAAGLCQARVVMGPPGNWTLPESWPGRDHRTATSSKWQLAIVTVSGSRIAHQAGQLEPPDLSSALSETLRLRPLPALHGNRAAAHLHKGPDTLISHKLAQILTDKTDYYPKPK